MEHRINSTGSKPSEQEIRKWYVEQPESNMVRAKTDANNALAGFTEEAIELAVREERDSFRESEVIAEIKKLGKFWPQFLQHLGFNILSYFVFTILTVICIVLVWQLFYDISPSDVIRKIVQEG
ncbi:MAG: hypothetical protein OXC57_11855 [Rhodobacteraceae bacterium]|nr:hypothetical protein [Paracoccaceae bacterium]